MANLTYFFKMITQYPELQVLFENDIKDLLGIRRNKPKESIYGFVFFDLLCGILKIGRISFLNKQQRQREMIFVRINDLLQQIVYHKFSASLPFAFKTEGAQKSVLDDFNRSMAWTGGGCWPTVWNQSAEKEVPSRTFDLDID